MTSLFRLTIATMLARKMWVVVLLVSILTPIIFPLFTPYETNTALLEPARAQTAWTCTWIVAILWTLSQAARFGESNSNSGMGSYFRSQGVGALRQIFALWGAVVMCLSFLSFAVSLYKHRSIQRRRVEELETKYEALSDLDKYPWVGKMQTRK